MGKTESCGESETLLLILVSPLIWITCVFNPSTVANAISWLLSAPALWVSSHSFKGHDSIAWCNLSFERHDFILQVYADSVSAEVRGVGD